MGTTPHRLATNTENGRIDAQQDVGTWYLRLASGHWMRHPPPFREGSDPLGDCGSFCLRKTLRLASPYSVALDKADALDPCRRSLLSTLSACSAVSGAVVILLRRLSVLTVLFILTRDQARPSELAPRTRGRLVGVGLCAPLG
jgi:hypothetical protein